MLSICERYGYEASFVRAVPDHFKCVVCQFVLRDPVQIMTCGHMYCSGCFERIKDYSLNFKSDFCCKVDHKVIDLSKVYKNAGVAKLIDELEVRCSFAANGCSWSDKLRNLQTHEANCGYHLKKINPMVVEEKSEAHPSINTLNQICARLEKCETGLLGKENDLASIKFQLKETKEKVEQKGKEIDILKEESIELQDEIRLLKEINHEFKEKIDEQHLSRGKIFPSINGKEIENVKSDIEMSKEAQLCIDRDVQYLKMKVEEICKKAPKVMVGFQSYNSNKNVSDLEKEIVQLKEQVAGIVSWKDTADMSLFKVGNDCLTLFQEIDSIRDHISDLENPKFWNQYLTVDNTVFVWRIHNFNRYAFKKDKYSPLFYSRTDAIICQLHMEWSNGEDLGVFLRLVKSEREMVPPFVQTIQFQVQSIDGTQLVREIAYDNPKKDKSLSTFKESASASTGHGFPKFLKKAEFPKYVVDDVMTITCTLIPTYHLSFPVN